VFYYSLLKVGLGAPGHFVGVGRGGTMKDFLIESDPTTRPMREESLAMKEEHAKDMFALRDGIA
jgi:hypothetical protein